MLDNRHDLAALDLVAEGAANIPKLPGVRRHGGLHEAEVDLRLAKIAFDLAELALDLAESRLTSPSSWSTRSNPSVICCRSPPNLLGHLLAESAERLAEDLELATQLLHDDHERSLAIVREMGGPFLRPAIISSLLCRGHCRGAMAEGEVRRSTRRAE